MARAYLWTLAVSFLAASCETVTADEQSIQTPLKDVWAAYMRGTRSLRELEPRVGNDRKVYGPLTLEIARVLSVPGDSAEDAGPGFAVEGQGFEALKKAKAVLVDGEKRPEVLKAGEVTLAFYARATPMYVHLKEVRRKGNLITLNYRFVHHSSEQITTHFALVPLGALTAGKYEVKPVQLVPDYSLIDPPPTPRRHSLEWERRIVSRPYSFEVK